MAKKTTKTTTKKAKAPEWTREALQKLHDDGKNDSEIGKIYGKSEDEVRKARKTSSYWEN